MINNKIITFDDGYRVSVDKGNCVVVEFKGQKSRSVHASHFKAVTAPSRAIEALKAKGLNPEDYLLARQSSETLIRASNGVRELIEEVTAVSSAEIEARNAKWEQARQDKIKRVFSASGFKDPVLVSIKNTDGWPLGVIVGEKHDYVSPKSWSDVFEAEALSVMESKTYASLESEYENSVEAEKTAMRLAEDAKKDKIQKALTEAKASGKPVVYRTFMTDRCMNGNDCECSIDSAVKYAMPDGLFKTSYTCCY